MNKSEMLEIAKLLRTGSRMMEYMLQTLGFSIIIPCEGLWILQQEDCGPNPFPQTNAHIFWDKDIFDFPEIDIRVPGHGTLRHLAILHPRGTGYLVPALENLKKSGPKIPDVHVNQTWGNKPFHFSASAQNLIAGCTTT